MHMLRRPARAAVPFVLGGVLVGAVALGATVGSRPVDPGDEVTTAAAASRPPTSSSAPPPSRASSAAPRSDLGDLVEAALARAEPSEPSEPSGQSGASGDSVRAPCSPSVVACVQLSTQHFWMVREGRVVRDGFISSGATDTETPIGTFQVQWKSKDHVSTKYRTPMPYAVFFDTQGNALHEGALGMQSRGCVRLEREDAKAFFDVLEPGDGVQILA